MESLALNEPAIIERVERIVYNIAYLLGQYVAKLSISMERFREWLVAFVSGIMSDLGLRNKLFTQYQETKCEM